MTISRLARLLNRIIGGRSSSAGQTQNTLTVFSSEEEEIGKTTAVQFKMVSSRSANSVCAPPSLSEVAQRCLSNSSNVDQTDYRFFSSFQRKNVERFLLPHLSPPDDPGCGVLGFVPSSSVSSSSTTAGSSDCSLLNICLLFYACATAKEMSCFRRRCGFSSSFFRFVPRWDVADAFQGPMQKAQTYQAVSL